MLITLSSLLDSDFKEFNPIMPLETFFPSEMLSNIKCAKYDNVDIAVFYYYDNIVTNHPLNLVA